MISNTGIILKLANHSLSICAQLKNLGSTLLCEYLTVHFSRRKFVTLTFTHRKPRIKRHPVDDELSSKCWILITKMNFNQLMNFAKLSQSPSRSLRLRWLYFQLSLPPTHPATHHSTHPAIRTSLNLASDNITAKRRVVYLSELGL